VFPQSLYLGIVGVAAGTVFQGLILTHRQLAGWLALLLTVALFTVPYFAA
jgi:hypothetical protein